MILLMVYFIVLYLLSWLIVGVMFVTIMIFYDQFFKILFVESNDSEFMTEIYNNGIMKKVLFSVYLACVFISVFVSLSLPVQRAVPYFHVVSTIMSFLMLSALTGVTYFLGVRGLNPEVTEKICTEYDDGTETCTWVPTGDTYFSIICVCSILMLSMYITPFIMRPIDAIQNWKPYILGFLAYLLMMPVFTNIFMIYAMCNLHDVSWGNRPSSTGQEAFTAKKKAQEQAKEDYQVFRTNFVFVWLAANVGYYILIIELRHSEGGRSDTLRDSDDGYLMYFSLGLSSLVLCRLVFSILYVL